MEKSEKVDERNILKTRKQCPKCGYVRGASELAADYECPKCGIIYDRYLEPEPEEVKEEEIIEKESSSRIQINVDELEQYGEEGETNVKLSGGIPVFNENDPKPWRRFCARNLDMIFGFGMATIILYGFGEFLDYFEPGTCGEIGKWFNAKFPPKVGAKLLYLVYSIFSYLLWMMLEFVTLCICGTTLFKWIYGVRIESSSGGKITADQFAGRSFDVWLKGVGGGIPLFMIYTYISAYIDLRHSNTTDWDSDNGLVVIYTEWGAFRWMFCSLLSFVLICVMIIPFIF